MVSKPGMEEQWLKQLLECMDKLKEIQSLAVESIKKMQVICKFLHLARYEQETPTKESGGQCATKERNLALYEQEKLTNENDGQCKLEDKKAIGAPQNQIIPPLHYSSTQQLLISLKIVLQNQIAFHLCRYPVITSF